MLIVIVCGMVNKSCRDLLDQMWKAALNAVDPKLRLLAALPKHTGGRVVIVGAGKAAAPMAIAAAEHYGALARGMVVTRYGHGFRAGESCGAIDVIETGHPLPDAAGTEAGARVLAMVRGLTSDDLVVGLWSGGGSALLEVPLPGLGLEDLSAINAALLASGAPISEMNCVRKHLSAIKGGRLAVAAGPARCISFAVSDVPGDDPSVIASGPMVADATTQTQARDILHHYGITVPAHVAAILSDSRFETPEPDDPRVRSWPFHIIARQSDALDAVATVAKRAGYAVLNRGTRIEGEAREVAPFDAALAIEIAARGVPTLVLGGGELTVTGGAGSQLGGPSREYALALALALKGQSAVCALAADTDGIDGSSDAAGAFVYPDTLSRATAHGLNAQEMLGAHHSGSFFHTLSDALVTGPTRTNVSDLRAILVSC